MSGHSKWANIQHKKSNKDFRKSKIFSKIIKEIFIAVKESGKNRVSFRLKKAILNAKSFNIPKNTIERTIQKALQVNKNNILYLEGQFHEISLIIECLTDNHIRTTSDIKIILNKKGGRLCRYGELNHLFNRIVCFSIEKKYFRSSIEDFELMAIDYGAKDFLRDDYYLHIYTDFESFGRMKKYLDKMNNFYNYLIKYLAVHPKYISDKYRKKILDIIEKLKEHEDVKKIYSNMKVLEKNNKV
ncbi:YebC/PmpR family DNA-binding transcriptional regulator [Blattabacterium cuenoti]|uniref:YebC/PmpR family DNA-binding transcriptional regulator n=1 Tax=Blattabacterium cuenoti TaxID=1653831 RepID=UPI00163CB8D4|nr:YebC/PmpR family DNA-binding transcriptional regulator [Blattabacterium cuenoti]